MAKIWIKAFACAAITAMVGVTAAAYGAEMVSLRLWYDGKMHNYNEQAVEITIDATKLTPGDMPPVVLNDRTLVPVRAITEAMGAQVSWNDELKEAYITRNKDIVVLQLENKKGSKNGVEFTMDVPPKAINDRTMIPVRAFSEAFDCVVDWKAETRTVAISTDSKTEKPEEPSMPETPTVPETPSTPETPVVPDKPTTPSTPQTPTPPTVSKIRVTNVNLPAASAENQAFTILCSGQISKFEEVKLDDKRIVVDIYNAEKALGQDNITVNNHSYVSGIRTAQHDINGTTVTRVVFDLKSAAGYTITKSTDGNSILVGFQRNKVTSININQSDAADVVTISAELPVSASVTAKASPRQLVIKVPNVDNYAAGNLNTGNANFITSASTSMSGTADLVLTLGVNNMVDYTTSQNGKQLVIRITKSTLSNMSYDSATRTLTMQKSTPIDIGSIAHTDNYLMGNYKLTLPGNYESNYGFGTYNIGDDVLKDIQVSTAAGKTTLQFNTKTIRALTVTQDNSNYYVHVKSPKEVYDKVLVLDAGHGLQDPGTSGNGQIEKELNLKVATLIYNKMQNANGIKTYITRIDDSYPTNASRAAMANEIGDVFISIHMNATTNALTNGTELLYTPHSNETSSKLTSQTVAAVLQKKLVAALATNDRGLKNRPDLIVLNQTKVPAVIVEVVFLSNPGDALKISSPEGQEKAAQAIYEGILELMNNYTLR